MCQPEVTEAGQRPGAHRGHRDPRLRIDVPGGQLTTGQLRTVGELARRYGPGPVAIAAQQLLLSLARCRERPELTACLHQAGLTVTEPPGAATPVFRGSPVAGIARDEILDGTLALQQIRHQHAAVATLPQAFTTTVSGSPRQDVLHEASDVSFSGVRHPDRGPGFDVRVGAALQACPARAGRLGVFVTLTEVPIVWAAFTSAFRDFGHRPLTPRERLALLLGDTGDTGDPADTRNNAAKSFRRLIEREYLRYHLADGPAPPPPTGPRDHVGVHPQRDGRFYVGLSPTPTAPAGLVALAGLAEAHGSTRVRITPYQKLIVLDVSSGQVEPFCRGLERIGLTARPGLSHRRPGSGLLTRQ